MIGSSPPVPSASALTVRVDLRQVGHEMDSETKHLQSYEDDTTQLLVFDTPGFGDTEGTTTDIANSIAISSMIRECQSVRFVILVEAESLRTGRGVLLKGLFDLLARFLNGAENYKVRLFSMVRYVDRCFRRHSSSDRSKRVMTTALTQTCRINE